jgi:hypothetical protein
MAHWEQLCELLLKQEVTSQEIIERLGVKPYRLRQMLESKRLAERLGLAEQIAARRADHAILLAVAAAAEKLAALAAKDTETGRKACLDVLAEARVVRTERDSAKKHHRLANWHNDYRKWERNEKRKAQRKGRAANTVPDGTVPPGGVTNTVPDGTVPPVGVTNTVPDGAVPPGSRPPEPVAPARDTAPRRMSKRKRRELAGLPPEEESPEARAARLRGKRAINLPAYGGDGGFIPRPGGTIVRHIVGGRVFLGST